MSNRPSDEKEWGHDWEKEYINYDVINIFGHEVHNKVKIDKNYIGIDTGCVYGKVLTALELNTLKTYEENCHDMDICLKKLQINL